MKQHDLEVEETESNRSNCCRNRSSSTGPWIAETDQVGQKAADSVEDPGPENAALYKTSLRIHDDHVWMGFYL